MSLSFEDTVERAAEWPLPAGAFTELPERRRPSRRIWRRARLLAARRAPIVMVVLAVVCTAALTAAVFVGMWTRESSRRKAVEAELADAKKTLAGTAERTRDLRTDRAKLAAALAAANARLARAQKDVRALLVAVNGLAGETRTVVRDLRDAGLAHRGEDVRALAKKLGTVTSTLTGYLEETSAATYDPGYVRVQLAYLADAIGKLEASAGSLASTAAANENVAGGLQARAERLAADLAKTRKRYR